MNQSNKNDEKFQSFSEKSFGTYLKPTGEVRDSWYSTRLSMGNCELTFCNKPEHEEMNNLGICQSCSELRFESHDNILASLEKSTDYLNSTMAKLIKHMADTGVYDLDPDNLDSCLRKLWDDKVVKSAELHCSKLISVDKLGDKILLQAEFIGTRTKEILNMMDHLDDSNQKIIKCRVNDILNHNVSTERSNILSTQLNNKENQNILNESLSSTESLKNEIAQVKKAYEKLRKWFDAKQESVEKLSTKLKSYELKEQEESALLEQKVYGDYSYSVSDSNEYDQLWTIIKNIHSQMIQKSKGYRESTGSVSASDVVGMLKLSLKYLRTGYINYKKIAMMHESLMLSDRSSIQNECNTSQVTFKRMRNIDSFIGSEG